MIPDLVPTEQRGSASGWMGLMTLLGNFAGGVMGFLIAPLGIANIYFIMIGVLIVGALVTWFGVNEIDIPHEIPPFKLGEFLHGLIEPFRYSDFTWVLMTRLLVMMGISIVQEFIQYYMGDVVKDFTLFGTKVADTAEAAVSFFIPALLIGAVITTLIAGVLSDKYGRKRMVYLAGALMGIVCFVFLFSHSFTLAVLMGIVFGLGYGAYTSVDWALVSDVLPSVDDYAKDMGIWHVADVLPQIVAGSIAGVLLDNFQRIGAANNMPNLGYTVIFLMAFAFFVLGTVFVARIKGVR